MNYQRQKTIYSKNYFIELKEHWLSPEQTLWNIMNRIDEFYNVIDNYLHRLEDRYIISKKSRKEFLNKSFKMLYDEIYLNAIIAIEWLDMWKDYIDDETNILKETKYKLTEIKKQIWKDLQHTFTPLIIQNVWFSSSWKNKKAKRLQHKKKSGRPKLIA